MCYVCVTPITAAFDTSAELNRGFSAKENLAQDYLNKMNESSVDLLIFPASVVPAPKRVRVKIWLCN